MGYIGRIRAVIVAEDMDELPEAVTETTLSAAPASSAALNSSLPGTRETVPA